MTAKNMLQFNDYCYSQNEKLAEVYVIQKKREDRRQSLQTQT